MMNFALAVLMVPLLIAQLQPPSPTTAKQEQEKQRVDNTTNGNGENDKNAATKVRPSIARQEPPNAQAVSHQAANHSQDETARNWWMTAQVIATGIIALCALIQLFIYARQTACMRRALAETAKAAAAAERTARAAETSAGTAARQVATTETATTAAVEAAKAAATALEIMRDQNAILAEAKAAAIRGAEAAEREANRPRGFDGDR